MKKLLVVELWGIGDLILATSFLQRVAGQYEILLVGKTHAAATLRRTYPELKFVEWDAPWTAFHGKYTLWRWKWRRLFRIIRELRRWRPDVAVSVRKDPRDHFLMWLTRARKRVGFGVHRSEIFLTDSLSYPQDKPRHVVEDWSAIAKHLVPEKDGKQLGVRLDHRNYTDDLGGNLFAARSDRPVVCLHVGARIAVRRWPENYFSELIQKLRQHFAFHLLLVPDPDGYGRLLASAADEVADNLSVERLIALIGEADLLISNDSAPAHIAAACGTPVIAIFGPADPLKFRPWSEHHHVVIRDICPYRPCFDYCHFPEPFCLTQLRPEDVWFEIHDYILKLVACGALPRAFLRAESGANIS